MRGSPNSQEPYNPSPKYLECCVLMGEMDFLLRVVTEDIETYERFFFEHLSQLPGVQEINSTVALSEIKSSIALPLPGRKQKTKQRRKSRWKRIGPAESARATGVSVSTQIDGGAADS
jgi:hypothetical protein